ncbi:MAG: CsgG/HfaB family protein [Myxococcota bacterium]
MRVLGLALFVLMVPPACTGHRSTHSAAVRDLPTPPARALRVAVTDFTDATPGGGVHAHGDSQPVAHAHGVVFADAFSRALLELPGYEVVERRELARVLAQHENLQLIGEATGELKKLMDLDGLVFGTVTGFAEDRELGHNHGDVRANARLVDLATGRIVWSAESQVRVMGTPEDAAAEAARGMVAELARKHPAGWSSVTTAR